VDTIADVAPVAEGAPGGSAWRRWTADEAQQAIGAPTPSCMGVLDNPTCRV